MTVRFSNLSVGGKLLVLGLLPTFLVLLLGAVAFAAFDLVSHKRYLARQISGTAHYIAVTTRASLRFEEDEYARRILAGLESNPDITMAAIYNEAGEVFSAYTAGSKTGLKVPDLERVKSQRAGNAVQAFAPVLLNERQIGTVYVEAHYGSLWRRLAALSGGLGSALALLAALAYIFSYRLQRHITRPILSLTETSRAISQHKDYSVRAQAQKGPEFALMTDAFNQMLEQIQSQDAELRSRAQELERANKELEAFTYTVSHDLRAPLRAIAGFSRILARDFAHQLPEEARDYLIRVKKGAHKMGELIDDLLAFSRIDAEPLKLAEVDPAALVREVFAELTVGEPARPAKLVVEPLPKPIADPVLLRQVYTNLISNALKYSRTRDQALVTAGTNNQDGQTVYFVRDNGVGFDMRYANKLFRIFQRLHRAEDFEGTGVGLAIVQRIIHRHGGKIWAEAEPEKGATFYFTLN